MALVKQGFWADPSLEPKRAYRWLVSIRGESDPIPDYIVKSITKPSFSISETSHRFLNHTFYYPGRLEWQTVDMTIVDIVNPDSAEILMKIIRDAGYYAPANQETAGVSMAKSNAIRQLGTVRIKQLLADNTPTAVPGTAEEWVLNNAWIKDVRFGELSYDSEEMSQISLTLRYDYAILEGYGGKSRGSGAGIPVA